MAHDSILTPADVIKQRMQLGTHSNSLKCFQEVKSLVKVRVRVRTRIRVRVRVLGGTRSSSLQMFPGSKQWLEEGFHSYLAAIQRVLNISSV